MRIALIGYGLGGSTFHAPFIATTPGLTLSAVVTGNASRQDEVRRRYPGAAVVGPPDDLWRQAGDHDLAVVTTPNRYHASHARSALEHGLHVVVDKPFAGSAAEARDLAALAEARGRLLVPFHNRRWDGDFLTVRRLLDTHALGDVHRFESRFERWRPQLKDSWKETDDLGSIVYDLGTHLVDQAITLFGRPRSVYAEVRALRRGAKAHDDAFIALTHDGTVSHLWMSALAEDQGPRFRVLGDEAAYVKHGMDPQEQALRDGESPASPGWGSEPPEAWGTLSGRPTPTEPGSYQSFYRTVAAGQAPVDVRDAITGLEVVEAALTSAATRSTVSLGD